MSVDATPAGPQANSYISEADALAYFASILSKDAIWGGIEDAIQSNLLIEATRSLDLLFEWVGIRSTSEQSLKWPRAEVEIDGYYIDSTIIPEAVKVATCDLAFFIFQSGSVSIQKDNLNALKVGPISLNFGSTSGNYPPLLNSTLTGYGFPRISKSGSARSVRVIRS